MTRPQSTPHTPHTTTASPSSPMLQLQAQPHGDHDGRHRRRLRRQCGSVHNALTHAPPPHKLPHTATPSQRQQQQSSSSSSLQPQQQQPQQRRSISFDIRRNTVRVVRVPARAHNRQYWFTESTRMVRKGFAFVIEPHISVDARVELRLQLTALAHTLPTRDDAQGAAPAVATTVLSSSSPTRQQQQQQQQRVYVEVCMQTSLLTTPYRASKWLCVGSVPVGGTTPLRVILPQGMYLLRSRGVHPVRVFAQAWEYERQLT